jgi:hypothetical protein
MQLDTFRFMIDPQNMPKIRSEMKSFLKNKQINDEKNIENQVADQSKKLAEQEKQALDKLMNDVNDLVKD